MSDRISEDLGRHNNNKKKKHGPNSQGVDWGADESKLFLRYGKMLDVLGEQCSPKPSLLDVGCGYGGLLNYAAAHRVDIDYTGIDIAENMIQWAADHQHGGRFITGDVLTHEFDTDFDYVVCNGILTQKLETPGLEMDRFAARLIHRLFSLSRRGLAFNVMTTKVNHFSNNLYYRNPAELLAWCMTEITPHIKLDHSYPLYEYTVYLFHEPSGPAKPEKGAR